MDFLHESRAYQTPVRVHMRLLRVLVYQQARPRHAQDYDAQGCPGMHPLWFDAFNFYGRCHPDWTTKSTEADCR